MRLWWLLRAMHPEIVDAHTPKAWLLAMLAGWLVLRPDRGDHGKLAPGANPTAQ
jgi:hypothetical protein